MNLQTDKGLKSKRIGLPGFLLGPHGPGRAHEVCKAMLESSSFSEQKDLVRTHRVLTYHLGVPDFRSSRLPAAVGDCGKCHHLGRTRCDSFASIAGHSL